jgi:hypothetical protein
VTDRTAQTQPTRADSGATAEFERLYRANVDAVTAYFARRTRDPQVVADLTADTFVAVITGFGSFDSRKGTARAWVFGIARRVYASYCESYRQQQNKLQRLAGRRDLGPDQVEELLERIDAPAGSWSPGWPRCRTVTGRWSSWSTWPGCGRTKRQPRSGWPRARCGCGSCAPAPACAAR